MRPGADTELAKALADFDFASQRKLGRTRLLVRAGPALGLMGTLIPLSPALDGLARGNVHELSQDLRVAFSVTVLGLLIGGVAFAVTLYRDRIYGQDLSDLEYVAAVLTDDTGLTSRRRAMIQVTPNARRREDRNGDPLDGLVNLFDLGIVLAVAFLLAALSSLNLTKAITKTGLNPVAPGTIQISPGQTIHTLPSPGAHAVGQGTKVGTVYRLPNGQLVYVTGTASP